MQRYQNYAKLGTCCQPGAMTVALTSNEKYLPLDTPTYYQPITNMLIYPGGCENELIDQGLRHAKAFRNIDKDNSTNIPIGSDIGYPPCCGQRSSA